MKRNQEADCLEHYLLMLIAVDDMPQILDPDQSIRHRAHEVREATLLAVTHRSTTVPRLAGDDDLLHLNILLGDEIVACIRVQLEYQIVPQVNLEHDYLKTLEGLLLQDAGVLTLNEVFKEEDFEVERRLT